MPIDEKDVSVLSPEAQKSHRRVQRVINHFASPAAPPKSTNVLATNNTSGDDSARKLGDLALDIVGNLAWAFPGVTGPVVGAGIALIKFFLPHDNYDINKYHADLLKLTNNIKNVLATMAIQKDLRELSKQSYIWESAIKEFTTLINVKDASATSISEIDPKIIETIHNSIQFKEFGKIIQEDIVIATLKADPDLNGPVDYADGDYWMMVKTKIEIYKTLFAYQLTAFKFTIISNTLLDIFHGTSSKTNDNDALYQTMKLRWNDFEKTMMEGGDLLHLNVMTVVWNNRIKMISDVEGTVFQKVWCSPAVYKPDDVFNKKGNCESARNEDPRCGWLVEEFPSSIMTPVGPYTISHYKVARLMSNDSTKSGWSGHWLNNVPAMIFYDKVGIVKGRNVVDVVLRDLSIDCVGGRKLFNANERHIYIKDTLRENYVKNIGGQFMAEVFDPLKKYISEKKKFILDVDHEIAPAQPKSCSIKLSWKEKAKLGTLWYPPDAQVCYGISYVSQIGVSEIKWGLEESCNHHAKPKLTITLDPSIESKVVAIHVYRFFKNKPGAERTTFTKLIGSLYRDKDKKFNPNQTLTDNVAASININNALPRAFNNHIMLFNLPKPQIGHHGHVSKPHRGEHEHISERPHEKEQREREEKILEQRAREAYFQGKITELQKLQSEIKNSDIKLDELKVEEILLDFQTRNVLLREEYKHDTVITRNQKFQKNVIDNKLQQLFTNFSRSEKADRLYHFEKFCKIILKFTDAQVEGKHLALFDAIRLKFLDTPLPQSIDQKVQSYAQKSVDSYNSLTTKEFWSLFSEGFAERDSLTFTVADHIGFLHYVKALQPNQPYPFESRTDKQNYINHILSEYQKPTSSIVDIYKIAAESLKDIPRAVQADIIQKVFLNILADHYEIKYTNTLKTPVKRKRKESEAILVDKRQKLEITAERQRKIREAELKKSGAVTRDLHNSIVVIEEKINKKEKADEIAKLIHEASDSSKWNKYSVTTVAIFNNQRMIATTKNSPSHRIIATELTRDGLDTKLYVRINQSNSHLHGEMIYLRQAIEALGRDPNTIREPFDIGENMTGNLGVSKEICPSCKMVLDTFKVKYDKNNVRTNEAKHWTSPFPFMGHPEYIVAFWKNSNAVTNTIDREEKAMPIANFATNNLSSAEQKFLNAAKAGDIQGLMDSLDTGVIDVNVKDRSGYTALFLAIIYRQDEAAEKLLSSFADFEIIDEFGNTPLLLIVENQLQKAFYRLINCPFSAGYLDKQEMVEGYTALHKATQQMDEDMVESLLQLNANVNLQSYEGDSALHMAVINEDSKTIKLLLTYGADVHLKNKEGLSPLELIIKNKLELALLLVLETDGLKVDLNEIQRLAKLHKSQNILDLIKIFQGNSLNSIPRARL